MTTPMKRLLAANAVNGMDKKELETLRAHFDTKKLSDAIGAANEAVQKLGRDNMLAEYIGILRENFPEAAKPYVQ